MKNVICPVSFQKVPSHLPRTAAFYTVLTVTLYTLTGWFPLLVFLVYDFIVRAMNRTELSIIFAVAVKTSKLLRLKSEPVDKAPKLFAARLGALMFIIASVLHISNLITASTIVALIVSLLASLEWIFNFCVGCYIYYAFVFPFYAKK